MNRARTAASSSTAAAASGDAMPPYSCMLMYSQYRPTAKWLRPKRKPPRAAWAVVLALKTKNASTASVNICTKGSIQWGKGPGAKASACAAPRISKPARRRSMCLSLFKSLLGWVGGSQRVGDVVLQVQPECALGIGANHGDVQALVADAVATPGNAPQFGGQPAAHGV